MIDPRDVGACAAAALTSERHEGHTYVLTGPRSITFTEVAHEISRVAGRPVEYVQLPDESARHGLIEAGTPAPVAEGIVAIFAALRRGAGEQVTDAVESLTGRPAADIAAYIHRHAHPFTPVTAGLAR
jgi:uncharacterized protein YbjT (DUF2867 family)